MNAAFRFTSQANGTFTERAARADHRESDERRIWGTEATESSFEDVIQPRKTEARRCLPVATVSVCETFTCETESPITSRSSRARSRTIFNSSRPACAHSGGIDSLQASRSSNWEQERKPYALLAGPDPTPVTRLQVLGKTQATLDLASSECAKRMPTLPRRSPQQRT
jgi:hypothetical protein